MKKYLLFITFCAVSFSYALTKNDLEGAIRSLDVASVKLILENKKLTIREYACYLNLAEEVIRGRELWILKRDSYYEDVATPSTMSKGKMALQLLASTALFIGAAGVANEYKFPYVKNREWYIITMFCSGVALLLKSAFDFDSDIKKQIKVFRKKYEDAVTIKQLIFAAEIVEA